MLRLRLLLLLLLLHAELLWWRGGSEQTGVGRRGQ